MRGAFHATVVLIVGAVTLAGPGVAPAEDVKGGVYTRDVKPILIRRCSACHGGLKQKSGLRLDTAAGALKGGKGGPAVIPGESAESPLIEVVTSSEGLRMPPEGEGEPVPAAEVAVLRAWIEAGAPAPATEAPQ